MIMSADTSAPAQKALFANVTKSKLLVRTTVSVMSTANVTMPVRTTMQKPKMKSNLQNVLSTVMSLRVTAGLSARLHLKMKKMNATSHAISPKKKAKNIAPSIVTWFVVMANVTLISV